MTKSLSGFSSALRNNEPKGLETTHAASLDPQDPATSPPSFGSEQLHHDLFQSKLKVHQLQKFKQQLDTRKNSTSANPAEVAAEERAYAQEFERVRREILEASAAADKNLEQARAARQEQQRRKRRLNRTRSASLGNIPDEMLTDSSLFDTTNAQSLSEIEREFHETEQRLYNNGNNNRQVVPPDTLRNEDHSPSPISRSNPIHDPVLSRPSSAPIPTQQPHHSPDNEEIMSLNYQLQEMQILLQQRNNHIESLNKENQRLSEMIAQQKQQQQQIDVPLDEENDRDPEDDYAILKNLISHLTRISGTLGARYKLPVSITRAIDYAVEGLEQLSQGKQIDKAYVRRLRSITRSSNVYYDKNDNNFEDSQDSEERIRAAETVAAEAAAEVEKHQQMLAQRNAQLAEMRRALADYYLTVLVQGSRIIDYDCVAAYLRAELAAYRVRARRQAEVLSTALAGMRAGELISRAMMTKNGAHGGISSRAVVGPGGYETRKEKMARMRAKFRAVAYMALAAVRMRGRVQTARAVRHEVQQWALSDGGGGRTAVELAGETQAIKVQMPVVSREAARLQAESRCSEMLNGQALSKSNGLLRQAVRAGRGGASSSSTVSTEKDRALRYY